VEYREALHQYKGRMRGDLSECRSSVATLREGNNQMLSAQKDLARRLVRLRDNIAVLDHILS